MELERHSHDAFGAKRNNTWGSPKPPEPLASAYTSQGYTGHELDEELNLINARGRIYDPRLGRFLQADALVPDMASSQSWNPYSYVQNRPLRFTDPSGFEDSPAGPNWSMGGGVVASDVTWEDGSRSVRLTTDMLTWSSSRPNDPDTASQADLPATRPAETEPTTFWQSVLDGYTHQAGPPDPVGWTGDIHSPIHLPSIFNHDAHMKFVERNEHYYNEELPEQMATGNYWGVALGMIARGTVDAKVAQLHADAIIGGSTPAPVKAPAPTAPPTQGTATVHLYETGNPKAPTHASIEVEFQGNEIHTHQEIAPGLGSTRIGLVTPLSPVPLVRTGSFRFDLPNASAAQIRQTMRLFEGELGPWNRMTNSCLTHCAEVLEAGGLPEVPTVNSLDRMRILNYLFNNGKKQ